MDKRRASMESYCSSQSSYIIQEEHNESLFIHQLKERPQFNFQIEMEEKEQFQTQYINQPHDRKDPYETVQDMLFTEEKLELPNQQIRQIPKHFQNFINIKLLNLTANGLNSLPAQMIKMINLKKLILNNNKLTSLPIFLQALKHLEILEVADNQIVTFNLHPPSLKHLNLAGNYIEQLFLPNLEYLCIQQNPFTIIPKGFNKVLYGMHHLELDWFKYCKPPLPQKVNFEKFAKVKDTLVFLLTSMDLDLYKFVRNLSQQEPTLQTTDYKDRNMFALAALNNEIGVIKGLNDIIPQLLNMTDFDQNTPLSAAYQDGKMRSVKVLLDLGAHFSKQTINTICQKIDLMYMRVIFEQNKAISENIFCPSEQGLAMYRNLDGNTPLHVLMMNFSRSSESKACAILLLQQGANPNAENSEGLTPLDVAVRKGQVQALHFAHQFNQSLEADPNKGIFFNFYTESGYNKYSLVHFAANIGNLEILEFLSNINLDFFSMCRQNRTPKNMAIQSLSMLKYMRKLEKKWIKKNIFQDNSYIEQAERNVYQMKNQIEKNMARRHENMIQKVIDQQDDEYFEMSSYNEASLRVASENSIREIIAESAPIFQRQAKQQTGNMQIMKHNMNQLNQVDFVDHNPEILRLLRSNNIDQALNKLNNALLSDLLPLQERLKYKNQLLILKYKFRNQKIEMKSQLSHGVQLVLNEYQFNKLNKEIRIQYLKLITQFIKDQIKVEQNKVQINIQRILSMCSSQKLNQDLYVTDLTLINELRNKLSNNLTYDLVNYAEELNNLYETQYIWNQTGQLGIRKLIISSNLPIMMNYEFVHELRIKKPPKSTMEPMKPLNQNINRQDIDNIDQDMMDLESSISHCQPFIQLSTPFQKQQ